MLLNVSSTSAFSKTSRITLPTWRPYWRSSITNSKAHAACSKRAHLPDGGLTKPKVVIESVYVSSSTILPESNPTNPNGRTQTQEKGQN